MMVKQKVPSLVDLCVQTAVDNVRYLGDVGETDIHLLERILPHCTVEQLMHIENSTEGRDLSPVTDKLWKKFYELQFGAKSTNVVTERMQQKKVTFKWKLLFEAKTKDLEEAQQNSFNRIKELYKKEDAPLDVVRKCKLAAYYIQVIHIGLSEEEWKIDETGKVHIRETKSASSALHKGSTFKQQKKLLWSREVKNVAAMKKNTLQRNHGVSSMRKPGGFSGSDSASTSKLSNPTRRIF